MIKNRFTSIFFPLLFAVLGIVIIYFGYLFLQTQISERQIFSISRPGQPTNPESSVTTSIFGTWECLPAGFSDEKGSDCAIGIKTLSDRYFLLVDYDKYHPKTIRRGFAYITGKPGMTVTSKDNKKVNLFLVTKR
ncbi:TPA: hypothetical protein DIU27_05490 [Candidatus Collierbacteria bacterium]|uniref:Uncharacterized protein n=1 Tax=Candidatus Collierbacteria bacterium GW2011_GWB2_44_22 TaxID=1618387 RepID=A0A0G1K6H3_9BACT|nr:MAG: hypothetical protein UW31_C0002G0068 [Candidatus Collierbacteria bacterium GW2011_GWA2_44_13]KKT48339.1 MAG: hypothetical protein UW42_C0061G0004 [Candidatus Collierbacteria bacterium GW2011_GWB1_44_197]KKT51927.1 MAG: hypothetical protein UW44_C0006G0045 [Candidatus Collierbacteria bacterium GW2011_GWB2_44_22]KKT61223.1 MAG: hypothetical protein UW56_C0030G0006 [Candidatus Collierbacteria bacterium GW2011_GWD1_44_27]KKT64261.1 MAG: hypothetical protein UW58_C0048G0004 [Candidatus Colli